MISQRLPHRQTVYACEERPDNSALSVVRSRGDKACDKSTAIVTGQTDCVFERDRAAIFIADKTTQKESGLKSFNNPIFETIADTHHTTFMHMLLQNVDRTSACPKRPPTALDV